MMTLGIETYFPDELKRFKLKEGEKHTDLLMDIKLELGRLDGMLRHNPLKAIVKAFLRAEEVLASASLDVRELGFIEYVEKLLDKGYKADDLNEIGFMVNYYTDINERVAEKHFSISLLDEFQKALLKNRKRRTVTRRELLKPRQFWFFDAKKVEKLDMIFYQFPDPDVIYSLMEDLDGFIKRSNMDPLLTTAIAYGQLALIHPWGYANARTTGALVPFLLEYFGLTREQSFYLSSAFCKEKADYFQKLVDLFNRGNWDEWVQYFLLKVYDQVISGQKKVDRIMSYCRILKAELLKNIFSKQTLLCIETMLKHPVFNRKEIERYGFNRGIILIYIHHMLDAGFIARDNRKRHINYIFKEVFEIMGL